MAPSTSSSSSATTSVQVALRIRPPTTQDTTSIPARFQRTVIHPTSSTSVSIETSASTPQAPGAAAVSSSTTGSAPKKQHFTFDQVHDPSTTQHALFTSTAQPLISRFLEGFNCTILAYGQTSSGKTFTMTGIDLDANPSDPNNGMGIIPRAVSTIFAQARQLKEERASAWNYSLKGSFIEIYNEDLIDLLSMDDGAGGRREVQIREDKDGHIIWGGLREVNVKNSNEVMTLIRKGTSIRRTNETDMNAQSSRSHAIFSLTLIQKKFTGSGAPPRSSSPLPPGRSPSRLARPGSVYAGSASAGTGNSRVSSPTFGRPATPSFAAAMGRGGGLRPSSALGNHGDRSSNHDEDAGEWVTITSKFHFVDLAGSERLKRTAAAGERIKEGISINSGLLALGNVISALGDPSRAKSHTATHIPYRDSKLTRLLQDSLGGNAHTLMIACVSPAEWNAAETINTLKYANRARNIKNRAVVNEKEEGWDDVEWLQGTVLRLRKELKGLKSGGSVSTLGEIQKESVVVEGAGKKVLAQMTELQNNYEDLREKFVERTEELTRLRRELGERHRNGSTGAVSGTGKYEEIVGPVIEEYEKTISAMEAELSLNRAALRHTNEMVEEKEEELTQVVERHAATELYVEELRGRVAKLMEREASTEAYVHDLEERMRTYDESSITSSTSLTDLKRELTRFRETESHQSQYIAELEARLAKSDESVITLQQSVEKLEREVDRRQEEVNALQRRLDALASDGEAWRSDLEERERKVKELEVKMNEWEKKRREASDARIRLGTVVGSIEEARRSLEQLSNVDIDEDSSTPPPISPAEATTAPNIKPASATDSADGPQPPVIRASSDSEPTSRAASPSLPPSRPMSPAQSSQLEKQFLALQQTHQATLADLSSVTNKYRDALREISDLAAQIQEAKLGSINGNSDAMSEATTDSESPNPPLNTLSPHTSPIKSSDRNSLRNRKMTSNGRMREGSEGSLGTNGGRRLFFRQAASAESLHSRSLSQSQSLSQELSSVRSRKASSSSHGTASSHSPSQSYSHPYSSINGGERSASRPNLSISLPSNGSPTVPSPHERSTASLEKEIMRLQEVLKEREAEITSLEQSLKESESKKHTVATAGSVSAPSTTSVATPTETTVTTPDTELPPDIEKSNGHAVPEAFLSPKTIHRFDNIRKSIQFIGQNGITREEDSGSDANPEENLDRLNELMLSMAQKESQHREIVDDLKEELNQVRRQFDELTNLSRDQALNMSTEVEAWKEKHASDLEKLGAIQKRETELIDALAQAEANHSTALTEIQTRHEGVLCDKEAEVDRLLASMKEEHDVVFAALREELSAASSALQRALEEHEAAFGKLKAEHAEELESRLKEAREALEAAKEMHDNAMLKAANEHSEALKEKEEETTASLHQTEEDYYNALTKLRGDHAQTLEKEAVDHAKILEQLKAEHASELQAVEAAKSGSLSESQSHQLAALEDLRTQHADVLARTERRYKEEMDNLTADHSRALIAQQGKHAKELENLRIEQEAIIIKLKEDWKAEAAQLNSALDTLKNESSGASAKVRAELEESLTFQKEQQSIILQDVLRGHQEELETMKESHEAELKRSVSQTEEQFSAHIRSRTEEFDKLKTQHQEEISAFNVRLATIQDQHRTELEELQAVGKQKIAEERVQLTEALNEMKIAHAKELDSLRKDHDLLLEELVSHKAAADDFALQRQHSLEAHERSLAEKDSFVKDTESKLLQSQAERDKLASQVADLRTQLEKTRSEQSKLVQEASKRESLVEDLERHRSVLAEMQENLQKVKDEKDNLQTEKTRSDTLLRELQAQIARSASPPNGRPANERSIGSFNRVTALQGAKLPPPTPPPSVPPPPAPRMAQHDPGHSVSSQTSSVLSSSSRDSQMQADSPATSVGPGSVIASSASDKQFIAKVEQQTKQIEEQEAMIKTLNKQLTHCESDLQTHMDLVGTLETSLGDSEKNLRKARMHATELARERDRLNSEIETLRRDLTEAKREVVSVRQSIVEEKQSYEQRLDEERRAKERARQQLDSRMEELTLKRKSKFACL
ncbi:kinesin-domain-containing protein [Marasmius fiardii PR-910]|nr:kinesin-domain-containing protein [Marasmius fiardii PR-910]